MKRKAGSYVKPVLLQSPLLVKMSKSLNSTFYNDNDTTKKSMSNSTMTLTSDTDNDSTNIIKTAVQRRWYNGQHSCLPSS